MTMTKESGACFLMPSATDVRILALVPSKSSRLMPGLRAMPAVTMQTSASAISSYLLVPITLPSKPSIGPACDKSSAFPCGSPSMTSNMTTSPSPFNSDKWAIEPPMLPAPIKAIFLRAIVLPFPSLHIGDNRVAESRAANEFGAGHEPLEIISHGLGVDGTLDAFDDEISSLRPVHIAQHHLAGQNHRTGIDLVEVCVLRRRSMSCLENRVAGVVIDIGPGRDADAADLRGERIGQVIAVQVHGRDDIVILRPDEHELQGDVGDRI